MKNSKQRSAFSISANPKALTVIFSVTIISVTIICIMGYFVGTSFANSGTTDTAEHRTNRTKTSNSEQWQTVQMRVTAYCPCPKCCGNYSDGVTASGHKIAQGDLFVAADKMYPFGTEMLIPGYKKGEAVKVLDRGGVIRGNRLDVFFNTHQEALEWGVRYMDVKIRYQ